MKRDESRSLTDRFVKSVGAGVVWGLVAMGVNNVTGAFPFESTFAHNIVSFIFGGVVFAIVSGGILHFAGNLLPFKGYLSKALLVTTAMWLVLYAAGVLMSSMSPVRYHEVTAQSVQGLGLAILLGLFLGLFWRFGTGGTKRLPAQ